jgi:prepilin-type N-terminal cleavage/methylation domain-containing protein
MKNNSAFTLVELAIVIVIIGLLVGGVLAGQELVRQAKISAQIKQIEQFNSAALTFKAKYNFIPGDLPSSHANKFSLSSIGSHTGDGQLNDYLGNIPNLHAYAEPIAFMQNLSQAKLIKAYLRMVANDYSVGKTFLEAEIGSGGIAAIGLPDGVYYFIGPTKRNDDGANSAAFIQSANTPALTPSDASGIDSKIDDGNPGTGIFRTTRVTHTLSTQFTNDATLNNCLGASTEVYNYATEAVTCRVIIKSSL